MNKTSIEWTDYTWNPVTGCLHSCRNTYCYNTIKFTSPLNRFGARYIGEDGSIVREKDWRKRENNQLHIAQKGEIYPYGFDPTFYPHRLKEPLKIKKPAKIFVVDTGDLFGEWVAGEWIEQILDVIKVCYWHTFIFLTKNPKRMLKYTFPPNVWAGTTVNSDKDIKRAEIIKNVSARITYLSIEPLLGEVSFCLEGLQWIIVGAQTGNKPVIPEKFWVDKILRDAERFNMPVFMKSNIKPYYPGLIQKFPLLF
jgi:protein gp37